MRNYVTIFLVLTGSWFAGGCSKIITNNPPKGETIVAFGDSLTSGVGADEGKTYPDFLAKRLGEPVLNRGVSGNTTEDGLKRLEQDVLSANPRIVIVWLGANDILQQLSATAAIDNLRKIVEAIQAKGALVVLVGIPELPFRANINEGVVQLAAEKGCVYIPYPMGGVLRDPDLKSDQIHPNSKGYELIAERIAKRVEKYTRHP